MNKHQKHCLSFAYRVHSLNCGWHSFAKDRQTVEIVCSLHNCGLIRVNKHRQFKITAFGIEKHNLLAK